MKFISNYKFTLLGIIVGSIGGYLYYHFIGCMGGTCVITSRLWNSTLYGALVGGLLLNTFTKEKTKSV